MFTNYFKIVWRNVIKDRQSTILNLLGLSTGLACTLMIFLWITDELNVDKYNEKDQQLYQVMENIKNEDGIKTIEGTAGLLGATLSKEIPEIEYSVSVMPASWFPFQGVITTGDVKMKGRGQYVSKDFFHAFSIEYIEGEKSSLFNSKSSVAI